MRTIALAPRADAYNLHGVTESVTIGTDKFFILFSPSPQIHQDSPRKVGSALSLSCKLCEPGAGPEALGAKSGAGSQYSMCVGAKSRNCLAKGNIRGNGGSRPGRNFNH